MAKSEIQKRAKFDFIRYAQCWEDPWVNAQALKVVEDDYVVSIASGGDNSFALLLDNPKAVVGCDINPVQLFVCELKKTAIINFDYNEFLGFLGVGYCSSRKKLFNKIKDQLSQDARIYFEHFHEQIEKGIIHCGKFEKYFHHFRRFILPLTHSSETVNLMLNAMTLDEQKQVYDHYWNSKRWRMLFKVFFNKFFVGRLGRDPEFFKYVEKKPIGPRLYRRAAHVFKDISMQDNYYMHYILKGKYIFKNALPPYLLEKNYDNLKNSIDKIEFVQESVEEHMNRIPEKTVSKINFSNIFEYMSVESMAQIFNVLVEKGRPGMTVAYRNLFVPRQCPESHKQYFKTDTKLAEKLNYAEQSFFYEKLVIDTLI